jgi:ring-1,2-phenylacetyl-CoA epoxidase subunit PaaD
VSPQAVDVLEHEVWKTLEGVADPEIPVISIVDLGIVREVRWDEGGNPPAVVVTVTPTYSGCPATEVIAAAIREALDRAGFGDAVVQTRLSPAWTTDWLTPAGREKLRSYGIAPPVGNAAEQVIDISRILRHRPVEPIVACPRCNSTRTQLTSQFGSTPCKALYRCTACKEPFDYFKCH